MEATDEASLGEALRSIETSLDIDDSDAWSHGVYAQLLFLLRRDEEAEIHFKRALALNPNDGMLPPYSPTFWYTGGGGVRR